MTCAFSPSGQSVACGGLDNVCSILNLNSPTDKDGNLPVSRLLNWHKGYVSCCQYIPDEVTHLLTSSDDQTCVLWDITTGLRTFVFGGEFQSGPTADVLSDQLRHQASHLANLSLNDSIWSNRYVSKRPDGRRNLYAGFDEKFGF